MKTDNYNDILFSLIFFILFKSFFRLSFCQFYYFHFFIKFLQKIIPKFQSNFSYFNFNKSVIFKNIMYVCCCISIIDL